MSLTEQTPKDPREKLIEKGTTYLDQLLKQADLTRITEQPFFFQFQIYLLYSLAAIAHNFTNPDNSPNLMQVHQNDNIRRTYLGELISKEGRSGVTFGQFYRSLFTEQNHSQFMQYLHDHNTAAAYDYALTHAKEEFAITSTP